MHSKIILVTLAAVIPVILAEELRADDVPSACTTICQPIVDLTNTCDIDPNEKDTDNDKKRKMRLRQREEDDEAIEANCICTNKSFDVAGVMGLCASCIAQNGNTSDGKDPDSVLSEDGQVLTASARIRCQQDHVAMLLHVHFIHPFRNDRCCRRSGPGDETRNHRRYLYIHGKRLIIHKRG